MKKLFTLFALIVFLSGCFTTTRKPPIIDNTITVKKELNCEEAPSLWWGEKGESPADNDLWLCNNWILSIMED